MSKLRRGKRLRLSHLEPTVGHAFAIRQLAGASDHPCIDIDPKRIAGGGDHRRFSCCLARPAADVQNMVCRPDTRSRTELLVVELELSVVVDHALP